MIDVNGAKYRLADCRPGAWLLSPFTGWKWAKWPGGEIGWLPADTALPDSACDRATIFISHHIETIDIMSSNLDHDYVGELTRRSIFIGAASSLIFAPSIVRAASLMKVCALILPMERPSAGFVERL